MILEAFLAVAIAGPTLAIQSPAPSAGEVTGDGTQLAQSGSTGGTLGRGKKDASGRKAKKPKVRKKKPKAKSKPKKITKKPKKKRTVRRALPQGPYKTYVGTVNFSCSSSGSCVGRYRGEGDGQPARVVGRISSSGVLNGVWVEASSNKKCTKKRHGSFYWGRVYFRFNSSRSSWSGSWSYCGASPSSSWNGAK